MNEIFSRAIKTGDLKLFAISFITDVLAFSNEEKLTAKIALRLHMGSPKNDELNKILLSYKFSKENILKNLLIETWRTDKNIEIKTRLLLDVMYNAMISFLLTGRPISVRQVEADVLFLLEN